MTNQIVINGSGNETSNGSSRHKQRPPHFVLVPLMAQGHMIPMVDLARLLADAGSTVTFITTPVNAARIRPVADRIRLSGLPITFVELRFPAAETGLPDGCESVDLITSADLFKPFFEALSLLADPLKLYLSELTPPPDCIIADSMNCWTASVARSLGLPRFIFHGPSCFFIFCSLMLRQHKSLAAVAGDLDPVVLPDLPQRIEMLKVQVVRWMDRPEWEKISQEVRAAEASAQGVVMNTFEELEPWCLERFRKTTGKTVWPIGPLSLYKEEVESKAARGKASSIDTELLLGWLKTKPADSVVLISFGSLSRNSLSQLVEIGRGLEEAAGVPFIWVVKETAAEAASWMEGFEERTKGRGLLIRGWAPQAVILAHPAVGGFMTHCGWNSTLEAVAAGVPMVTWPRFGDQFLNEKLVVEVLQIGVPVGARLPTLFVDEMSQEAQVKGEQVGEAVVRVMAGGMEGEEMRRRARGLGEKARRTMEEGGSSCENLKRMMEVADLQHHVHAAKIKI
ncbi:UDP-glycosyltransferase 73C4 [Apostasia shenzhenica]|uniref:Glycosyltransferase n=1 Tax=Apostasia shenzhenica TaxID=1088818 RepID=A0A2I0B9V1_9ASPA|nr:UDP-glycosyltransferase 73C4 [Apostasia shenzhenica]